MSNQGLRNMAVADSNTGLVNGAEGKLIYVGYKIEDLAENALYEEVVYLLWNGRLPNKAELEAIRADIANNAVLPAPVLEFMKSLPTDANGMAVLRTVVSLLSIYDAEGETQTLDAVKRKAVRLVGQITTACAAWIRLSKGQEIIAPRTDLNLAANFVYMITGETDAAAVEAINVYLVLLAEHGMNASTFTSRVVTATNADLHSAIVAAIGALKGPSHGGANSEAMRMFLEIGEVSNVQPWFDANIKTGSRRIMGIGHAIYKALDPRASILKEKARALAHSSGNAKWFDIAEALDNSARADQYFIERNLYANVDYYSAIVLYTLDIDVDMFTPLFAMSRIAGWSAHVIEQMQNNRLIRPDMNYTGPMDLAWTPVEQR
ncbi:MAG: citrate/2-methylcitrate synthase [Anaerolineae bacterium]|jgi:citrate synthase|nr:citrate/2-methylcitrate synthase [Anaerolineae bacterium]